MATEKRKRTTACSVAEQPKRMRIETSIRGDDEIPLPFQASNEESDYNSNQDESSEDDGPHATNTPATPFSPAPKFPSELKTIKCTFEGCTKTFNRPARLASHLRSHNNERLYACTYVGCDKSYLERKHLDQHVKGSHTHERSYHCDWAGCGKSFLTATRLRRHKESHEGHQRFRCTAYPPCNQAFRKHQTLQRHIRSDHLDLAPFPCTHVDPATSEACQSGFDAASKLRRHSDQVHGTLKFFCDLCKGAEKQTDLDASSIKVGFTTKAQLENHLRNSHTNCHFCERKCSSQRELQKHIENQHSGITLEQRKKIACTYTGCAKSFTKKYNLNVHISTTHKGERFICGTFLINRTPGLSSWDNESGCGRDFMSKANLEYHVRTAHLGLANLNNARRKKTSPNVDSDGQPNRKAYQRKPSVMDELLGNSYAADERRNILCIIPTCPSKFIRDYDLQTHMRSKHRLSTPKIDELTEVMDGFGSNPKYPEAVFNQDEDNTLEDRIDLDARNYQTDIEWGMENHDFEGGPFWVGADEMDEAVATGTDQWTQDEAEMRRLIDQLDPELYGI